MEWLFAGITFGFLGSFHCIGMCGPIALALPDSGRPKASYIFSRLVYNSGRVITYTLLGVVAGFFSHAISLGGYQQALSIFMGSVILGASLFSRFGNVLNRWKSVPSKIIQKATRPVKSLLASDNLSSLLAIGLLNGFLPCGFVYLALATAATTGAVSSSLFFMAAFGFGTVPAMLGMSLAGGVVSLSFRQKLQRAMPYFTAIVGILLIARGLGLGIPFISPAL